MRYLFSYLATDGAFLYEDLGAEIVNSEYVDRFGGLGSVVLRCKPVEIRLELDRGMGSHPVISLDVRPIGGKEWYSLDIISELLTGVVSHSAEMNESNAQFLRENFSRIKSKFSALELDATERHCKKLERKRADRLFPKR